MKVYASMDQRMPLSAVEAHARRVESLGYDGLCVPDALHDGLLACHAALRATTRLRARTSVLVSFPRSPMLVAISAWDLQQSSGGRFELGLGTQVRGNIVGRYATPWTPPVPRMREYVRALRAIWDAFQHGAPLDFRGEHYRFTKLQPFFNPGPIETPQIPVLLGAVGPRMTQLVGEVADGMLTHPTNSAPRTLRELCWPALRTGAERSGRDAALLELMAGGFVITGATPEALAASREQVRELLCFLYSTPAYWPTLELFGWREIGERLQRQAREGRWAEMRGAVSDEMLDALVPQGSHAQIADVLGAWYGGVATSLTFPLPDDPTHDGRIAEVIAALQDRR